jgi:sugar lactone lactonase YvrE
MSTMSEIGAAKGADTRRQEATMSEVKTLLDGLAIGESTRWHDGRLWLANWLTGEIVAVDAAGRSEVVVRVPAVIPYCFDWTSDGRLLVVNGSEATLLRQGDDGELNLFAKLIGPDAVYNEIVVDGRGNAYVNGVGYDMETGENISPGSILLVTPDGSARQVAEDLAFANGMAVTPDNAVLIVAESHASRLTAFDIQPDGSLSRRRVWADLGDGVPDGICLDDEGAAWYADVPHARCVRVREGGEVLDTVAADRGCFACMLGGPDGTTLFIAAAVWSDDDFDFNQRTGRLLASPAPAPGAGWPRRTP